MNAISNVCARETKPIRNKKGGRSDRLVGPIETGMLFHIVLDGRVFCRKLITQRGD